MGARIKIAMMISPNGFHKTAAERSPFRIEITERVDPHDGHGKLVIRLNKQTAGSPECMTTLL